MLLFLSLHVLYHVPINSPFISLPSCDSASVNGLEMLARIRQKELQYTFEQQTEACQCYATCC